MRCLKSFVALGAVLFLCFGAGQAAAATVTIAATPTAKVTTAAPPVRAPRIPASVC